jgi:hypothetical protein
VTTGRVYISRDVVFDENIFLFASLHPNAGRRLREEILLLPQDNSSSASHNRGVHTNDHYLQLVPIVSPPHVHVEGSPPNSDQETSQNSRENKENGTSNDESTQENRTKPDSSDPESDSAESDSDHASSDPVIRVEGTPTRAPPL